MHRGIMRTSHVLQVSIQKEKTPIAGLLEAQWRDPGGADKRF